MYPFSFLFNSASLFKYSNFPVWAFVRRKTFWFVLLTLYLYYCLEWTPSVSSCRISGDLAPHSKSLTLFKMYCFHKDACAQPLSSLCSFSLLISSLSHFISFSHTLAFFLPRLHLYLSSCRTRRERASWTSFMPFRTCASVCRTHWMKWPPMGRG